MSIRRLVFRIQVGFELNGRARHQTPSGSLPGFEIVQLLSPLPVGFRISWSIGRFGFDPAEQNPTNHFWLPPRLPGRAGEGFLALVLYSNSTSTGRIRSIPNWMHTSRSIYRIRITPNPRAPQAMARVQHHVVHSNPAGPSPALPGSRGGSQRDLKGASAATDPNPTVPGLSR